MKLRVILPNSNVRKVDSDAVSVEVLCHDIQTKLGKTEPDVFILHYLDTDFDEYFNLDNAENIADKMTVKFVKCKSSTETISNNADVQSSSIETPTDKVLRKNDFNGYKLPLFDADTELALTNSNVEYGERGITTMLSHGLKSSVLTTLVSDIYHQYSSYPSTSDLERVAQNIVAAYVGVKDIGNGYDS
jgi:hypothetical protein